MKEKLIFLAAVAAILTACWAVDRVAEKWASEMVIY